MLTKREKITTHRQLGAEGRSKRAVKEDDEGEMVWCWWLYYYLG